MSGRYQCTLSDEALKKAVEELNEPEDNDLRLAAIDQLRTRFEEEACDLELIRNDDAFILRFVILSVILDFANVLLCGSFILFYSH